MRERIRLLIFNKKTWIYQLQYIGYSILLLMIVLAIDTQKMPLEDKIPGILYTSVDLAKTLLSALAGALLTITTFTFSTIMTVATFYAANFTPRAIDNFIKNGIVMKILGIFMGGFFYAITALVFMRETSDYDQVIAGTVGVLYAIFGLVYFIRFVQQVLYSAKGVNLISDIYDETEPLVLEEVEKRKKINPDELIKDYAHELKLYAKVSGYFGSIHMKDFEDSLAGSNSVVRVHHQFGDFVVEGDHLATLHTKDANTDLDKDKLCKAFAIQDEKIPYDDYRYGLTQLNEISLRALSTGINDPNSAIHCINKTSLLLSKVLSAEGKYFVEGNKEDVLFIYSTPTAMVELYDAFSLIIHYGKSDISVLQAIMHALQTIYFKASSLNKPDIRKFVTYAMDEAIGEIPLSLDHAAVEKVYKRILEYEENVQTGEK